MDHEGLDSQRLDIFLYRTRLIKTRALAGRLISSGKVRMTRAPITDASVTERIKKPHTRVRPGDSISFMRGQTMLDLQICAIPERRGPASEARDCYNLNQAPQISAYAAPKLDKSRSSRHIPREI